MMGFQVSEFSCPWGLCSGCKFGEVFLRFGCVVFRWAPKKGQPTVVCPILRPVSCVAIWGFPKIVVPQNGWFRMENPISKMDDLGVPPFKETSKFSSNHTLFLCGHLRYAMEIFIISALLNVVFPRENAVDQLWQGRKIWGGKCFLPGMTGFQ